ncbi:MAG: hypothetical protein ACLFM4_15250 [Phormidium sp.]
MNRLKEAKFSRISPQAIAPSRPITAIAQPTFHHPSPHELSLLPKRCQR